MCARLVFGLCFLRAVSCYIGVLFQFHNLGIPNVYNRFTPIYTDECRDITTLNQLYETIYWNKNIKLNSDSIIFKNLVGNHVGYTKLQVLSNIFYISFTDCTNNSIGAEVIQNLPDLETLAIKRVELESIPPKIFNGIAVKQLDFSENNLSLVQNATFTNLPNLERLFLFQNKIKVWYPECIENTPNLVVLDLGNNELEEIQPKAFYSTRNLKFLNLMSNRIKTLHSNSFWKMNALNVLDLRSNQILVLPSKIFTSLKRLRLLLLHNNQLVYVEQEHLVDLIFIDFLTIASNPWQCACYNDIVDWAHKNSIVLFVPKCDNETNIVCTISSNKCLPIYDTNQVSQFRANTKISKCFIEPHDLHSTLRRAGVANNLEVHLDLWIRSNTK